MRVGWCDVLQAGLTWGANGAANAKAAYVSGFAGRREDWMKKRDGESDWERHFQLLQRAVAKDSFESFWVGFKSRPDWVWRLITTFLGNSINRHALAKLPAAGGEERSTVRFAGPGSVVVVTYLPSRITYW